MADLMGGERSSLSQFAKQKNKYGSTSKNSVRKEKTIQHVVLPSDTLQGIALKYGVTMEEVKRANKLWTADSLFLRTSLSIPVPNDFLESPSTSGSSTPATSPQKTLNRNGSRELRMSPSSSLGAASSGLESSLHNGLTNGRQREESIEDFLIRVDSNIALSRDKVRMLENSTSEPEDYHSGRWRHQRHFKENGFGASHSKDYFDPSMAPQPSVIMTQGRKVVTSLKRLEREQDELFEL